MKRILITMLAFSTNAVLAQNYKLVTEDYPPFEYKENGKAMGMDIEILDAVKAKAGIDLSIEFLPWNRALDQVQKGTADGIFSMLKNAEREAFLQFPAQPLYTSRTVIFAHESFAGDIKSLDDLKGQTVGVVLGNSYGKSFDSATHFTKDGAADQDTMMKKFISGRSKLVITSEEVGQYQLKNLGGKGRVLSLKVAKEQYYVGISKASANGKALFDKMAQAFAELEKSGELNKIRAKYK